MEATPSNKSAIVRSTSSVRSLPWLGSAIRVALNPLGFLEQISAESDVTLFHAIGKRHVLLNHPDLVDAFFVTQREHLNKGPMWERASTMFGRGMLFSDGSSWRKQRRLSQPAFHRPRVAAYADIMVNATVRCTKDWRDGVVRDVYPDMKALILYIVAKTLLGVDMADADIIGSAFDTVVARFEGAHYMVPYIVPTPRNLRARRALKALDRRLYGLIAERQKGGDTGDILSMLVATSTEEDGGFTDSQIRDELMTILVAGFETTTVTTSYALHLLSRHSAVVERLLGELQEVVGDRLPTAEDFPKLTFFQGVVHETMRLYPAAWIIYRNVDEPCVIGGQPLVPGDQVCVSPWLLHRDARWFDDPHSFRPERWDGDFMKMLPRNVYVPFGAGPRMCIGSAFASMEMVLILATLLRKFRPTSVNDEPLLLNPALTLRPKKGVPVAFKCR